MIFLNLAIWLPILAGVVLLALGRDDNARAVRWIDRIRSTHASSARASAWWTYVGSSPATMCTS